MAKDPRRPLDFLVLPLAGLSAATSGLPAETLGILLQLLIRCAKELNSGRIDYAAATTNAPQVNIPGIWHWEGSTLVLDIYPAEYEAKALAKRYTTAANAAARWEKPLRTQNGAHANACSETCNGIEKTPVLHTPDMQLHQKTCNGMQLSMQLHPCAPACAVNDKNKFRGGDSARMRASSAPHETLVVPTTPPPFENKDFETWWRLIAATHPSGKLMRQLPGDIAQAAWSAYQTIPAAAEYAALLEAYMSSRLQKNKYGERFFRASGVARYFDTLADHINHAERWAVETGYHRKNARAAPAPPATPPDPPTQHQKQEATAEDIAQFLSEIQQYKDVSAPQHINHEQSAPT